VLLLSSFVLFSVNTLWRRWWYCHLCLFHTLCMGWWYCSLCFLHTLWRRWWYRYLCLFHTLWRGWWYCYLCLLHSLCLGGNCCKLSFSLSSMKWSVLMTVFFLPSMNLSGFFTPLYVWSSMNCRVLRFTLYYFIFYEGIVDPHIILTLILILI